MRILDEDSKKALTAVTLYLTKPEAEELKDSIEALLSDPARQHEHVSDAEYKTEVTVCIYDPANLEQLDKRSQVIINDGT